MILAKQSQTVASLIPEIENLSEMPYADIQYTIKKS